MTSRPRGAAHCPMCEHEFNTPVIINLHGEIFREVDDELTRQLCKWGVQRHEPLLWNAILGEEVGEVSKAILETWFHGRADTDGGLQYRKELIQVAAVAISAIRAFDLSVLAAEAVRQENGGAS